MFVIDQGSPIMAPNYRSLIPNGFFSSTPFDRRIPASIRCNNPGAVNGSSWEKRYPGYVDTVETTPGNRTTIFEAPEYGVAVWWELLRRYAATNAKTVGQIINKYGGGQDYSNYIKFVSKKTGYDENYEISLQDNTALLAFGRAMFQYEAGRATPLSDEQILYGLKLGRADGIESINTFRADVSTDIRPSNAAALAFVEAEVAKDGNCLVYEQATGGMSERVDGQYDLLGTGYSGSLTGGGYNNPSKQCVPKIGPIPRGRYKVGAPRPGPSPYSLPLTPLEGTDTCGRSGFLVHGDSINHPGDASEGCIILKKGDRETIVKTGLKLLLVVDHISS